MPVSLNSDRFTVPREPLCPGLPYISTPGRCFLVYNTTMCYIVITWSMTPVDVGSTDRQLKIVLELSLEDFLFYAKVDVLKI